jgi:excinuclease UvrABC nuclease subunit
MVIYKQRRSKPYKENGKTTFNIQGKPGVYLIYKNDKLRYIGYSGTNVYKTLYRHFQKWTDKTQVRVTYPDLTGITVRIVYTTNGSQASNLERALIVKYSPVDNPNKYLQYNLKPVDQKKVTEFINEPIKDIARFTGDIPF